MVVMMIVVMMIVVMMIVVRGRRFGSVRMPAGQVLSGAGERASGRGSHGWGAPWQRLRPFYRLVPRGATASVGGASGRA